MTSSLGRLFRLPWSSPRVNYYIGHLSLNNGSSYADPLEWISEFEFPRLVLLSNMSRTGGSFGKSWPFLTLNFFICRQGTYGDDNVLLFTFESEQDDLFLYSIFQIAHRTCMPGCE